MKTPILLAVLLLLALPVTALADDTLTHALDAWSRVLSENVDKQGLVDYTAIRKDPSDLKTYLAWAAKLSTSTYDRMSGKEKLAFWINTYNAATLKLIIDHHPIRSTGVDGPKNSIRQIPGNWDKVTFEVMGRKMTLNNMEHDTVRKEFNEPGVHVALVCAAKGCPFLLDTPYTADKLDERLAEQARRYFAAPTGLKLDRSGKTLYLSSIYDWFKDDFVKTYGKGKGFSRYGEKNAAVLRYVSKHVSKSIQDEIATEKYTIKYLDYDWTLNEQ